MKKVLACLGFAALIGGCGVSKEIVAQKDAAYSTCQEELATCQTDRDGNRAKADQLSAQLAGMRRRAEGAEKEAATQGQQALTCERNLDTCRSASTKAEADLRSARGELTTCQAAATLAQGEAEKAKREAASLQQQGDSLRSKLQREIDNKSVEIENLKGKLSVRVLDEILFASGSARVLAQGQEVLTKVASVLAGSTEMIRVEGHTDDVPIGAALQAKYASNWELSAARASSVVRHFESVAGIDPARLEAVGRSMHSPVASNETPEGRQKNRRVELVLVAAR